MAAGEQHLHKLEERVRGELNYWLSEVKRLRTEFENAVRSNNTYQGRWFEQFLPALTRIEREMQGSQTDLTVISESLTAAKSEADYREVLVRAWPTNHFLDRMTYLGAAVLGAGGAAYVLVGRDVSFLFWGVGGILMGWGLLGLRKWETKKWNFYADQFSVDPKYRP